MRLLLKSLLVLILGLGAALPAFEDGGGGDTGVWILPRCTNIGSRTNLINAPLGTRSFGSLSAGVSMSVSEEMLAPTASLTLANGTVLPLPTRGLTVDVPASVLQSLALTESRAATGVIVDANGYGYLFEVRINPDRRGGSIAVY